MRAVVRHPFLVLFSLPTVVVLALALWQLTPGCREWQRWVDGATHLEMREQFGTDPDAASVRITQEGHWDDSWVRMRRDIGTLVARDIDKERPPACL